MSHIDQSRADAVRLREYMRRDTTYRLVDLMHGTRIPRARIHAALAEMVRERQVERRQDGMRYALREQREVSA